MRGEEDSWRQSSKIPTTLFSVLARTRAPLRRRCRHHRQNHSGARVSTVRGVRRRPAVAFRDAHRALHDLESRVARKTSLVSSRRLLASICLATGPGVLGWLAPRFVSPFLTSLRVSSFPRRDWSSTSRVCQDSVTTLRGMFRGKSRKRFSTRRMAFFTPREKESPASCGGFQEDRARHLRQRARKTRTPRFN